MVKDTGFLIALSKIKDIGPVRFFKLFGKYKSIEKLFSFSYEDLLQLRIKNDKAIEILKLRDLLDPEQEYKKSCEQGISVVSFFSDEYPERLKQIYAPPYILYVKGLLNKEEVHIFVNHWPSRRDGDRETSFKRVQAADTILEFMKGIESEIASPNYIIMGDFNDGPNSESIKRLMQSEQLFNPMEKLLTPERGSANYKKSWLLFDQILVSHNFFNYQKGTHSFAHANIFDEK